MWLFNEWWCGCLMSGGVVVEGVVVWLFNEWCGCLMSGGVVV